MSQNQSTSRPESFAFHRFAPHSIDDRAYWRRIAEDARYAPVREVIDLIAGSTPFRPALPMACDFLAARRNNDRSRVDWHWQAQRPHLTALALRRCMLGIDAENRDDRLLNWLWDLLNQPTWAVVAHLPGQELPAGGVHTIDLAACDMLLTMAEALEILKPWIDAQSQTLAGTIVHEMDRRVLRPFGEGVDVWWGRRGGETNNWTGVCAGCILAACETMAALGQPRPAARQRALDLLNHFIMRGFTPHGECDEGLIYWSYGLGMACVGLSRLDENELHRAIDMQRLKQVAEYPQRAHLSGDLFFSGNDAQLHHAAEVYFMPWLAAAVNSPWLMEWSRRHPVYPFNNVGRALGDLEGIDIMAENPAADGSGGQSPAGRPQLLDDQQVGILRTPTPAGELIACLTGGHNGERHNHNDLGHFLIALNDRVIVPDLGGPRYTADFFGPNRYKYLPASSRGHCCPIIAGFEQRDGKEAAGKVLAWNPDDPSPVFELELAAAYPPEAGLISWTRSLRQQPGRFVITDRYRTKLPRQPITHVIWSAEPISPRSAPLGLGPLTCGISPPKKIEITAVDPAMHRLRDWTQTLYQVHTSYETDEAGILLVATEFFVTAAYNAAS